MDTNFKNGLKVVGVDTGAFHVRYARRTKSEPFRGSLSCIWILELCLVSPLTLVLGLGRLKLHLGYPRAAPLGRTAY